VVEERELRRAQAFDVAWRRLAHRDRTEAEIVDAFLKARVEPELAEEVLGELREGGYVDDAQFARRFVEDRRRLDAWGSDRIERRLGELGVARELVRAALGGDGAHDELEAAVALLARRFPAPPSTPRERDRLLGVLVRKGYDLELAYDALRRFAAEPVE
jgi:regulatory protein